MAESTKGVEENDKGTEGKERRYRRERGNAEWRQEEEEKEDDDAKEEGEERAAKGKSNLHPATAPDLGRTNH